MSSYSSRRTLAALLAPLAAAAGCGRADAHAVNERALEAVSAAASGAPLPARVPNEMGRIPVLMYHLVGDSERTWTRSRANFRRDLESLYERGYRPVNMADVIDRKIDIAAGTSPVVITFDDASPGQFRYVERDGSLEIDSTSALGIWLDFARTHPGWSNKAVFCMLSGASAGHAFFGDGGIQGQKTEWRHAKVRQLHELGFELCDHTLWHARLDRYDDAMVQEQIARGLMAIDSAVPGYRVRSFALPLGVWPKNRALAKQGSWTDPKTGRTVHYDFDAIFEVSGTAIPSPYSPAFNALSVQRIRASGKFVEQVLDRLETRQERYVAGAHSPLAAFSGSESRD